MMIMIPEGGGGGGGRWKPPRGTGHDDVMIKKTTMKTISNTLMKIMISMLT